MNYEEKYKEALSWMQSTMLDKTQLIKQGIESYKESMKGLEPHSDFRRGQLTAYNQIMQFIDSLPEEPCCEIDLHTNFKDFYKPEDLDFNIPQETEQSSSFDWQSFRNQAAKDILCAMIARGEKVKDIVVSIAIDGADKLIKELKEREEK